MNTDIAEPSCQSKLAENELWITLPNRYPAFPPTICGVTYSPIVGMNTNTNAAITPGIDIGSVTFRNVVQRLAPRSLDASSICRSRLSSDTKIGSATNGTHE